MSKISILFLIVFFISVAGFSQKVKVDVYIENKESKPPSDTIYYDPNRTLTWADFQGKPDVNHFAGAVTASGFAFDADIKIVENQMSLKIGVYTFFSKKDSWKKPDVNSSYHLLHEQRHFDITRIGAENFANQIAKANFTQNNYNELMTSIFNKAYAESIAAQEKYDKETHHSIDHDAQLKWNDKIYDDLTATLKK